MQVEFAAHRRHASNILLGAIVAHIPLNTLVAWANGTEVVALGLASAVVAATVIFVRLASPSDEAVRVTMATGYMGTIGLLLAAMKGHEWQVDVHMYFFAALALIAMYCDWRAILAGTLTVAVHHLSLNYLLPSVVYPGGADLARVLVHAVILIAEAAGLIWLTAQISSSSAATARALEEAQAASAKAEAAAQSLRREADERERVEALRRKEMTAASEEQSAVAACLANAIGRLADRDLTARIGSEMPKAYEALGQDFNRAVEQLSAAIGSVADTSSSVTAKSGEISSSADELARRTEQQAATLEQTAAALGEITQAGHKAAEGAAHAREVVANAKADAEETSTVVRRAVDAVGNIEQSSQQIGRITGVIEEIAFQTNLLALNAGVEAARAGEAGRGFAVVASEVRALAQRASGAAKEINGLISTSMAQVAEGVQLVGKTGEALSRIVSSVDEINTAVVGIASRSQDQSTALQQVNTAIGTMDQSTQRNAAMVEETTAATHALAQEMSNLNAEIALFRVGSGAAAGPRANRRAA